MNRYLSLQAHNRLVNSPFGLLGPKRMPCRLLSDIRSGNDIIVGTWASRRSLLSLAATNYF
jgi:hypothetical protein